MPSFRLVSPSGERSPSFGRTERDTFVAAYTLQAHHLPPWLQQVSHDFLALLYSAVVRRNYSERSNKTRSKAWRARERAASTSYLRPGHARPAMLVHPCSPAGLQSRPYLRRLAAQAQAQAQAQAHANEPKPKPKPVGVARICSSHRFAEPQTCGFSTCACATRRPRRFRPLLSAAHGRPPR